MAKRGIGTCTECGEENVMVNVVDDETILCDDCLGDDYIECDECHELWLYDAIKFYELKDGRTLCEYCAEDMLDEGELTEDDIEDIQDCTI